MNRRKANWMAIVAGAGVLCSAAWVCAEETAAPAAAGAPAPAAEPKAEIKPVVAAPVAESPLQRLQAMRAEGMELQRTIMGKQTKLLAEKPDLKKTLDAADEKMKALQAEMIAVQASKQNAFCEADPELKELYARLAKLRAEMPTFRPRPAGQPGQTGDAPAVTPHVHTAGEAAPAAK